MKSVFLIISTILLLTLASCSAKNVGVGSQSLSNSASLDSDTSATLVALHNNIVGDRKLAQTKDGMYILEPCVSNNDLFTIRYIDYASKTSSILCPRPECEHNNESCNGCIPAKYGGAYGFVINTQLYFVFKGSAIEKIVSRLISMNLDGSDHKTVLEFSPSVEISTPLITDNENIYFITKEFKIDDDGGVKTTSKLAKASLASGKLEITFSFKDDTFICGVNKNSLLLQIPENYDTAGSAVKIPGQGNIFSIVRVSLDGSTQKQLMQINDENCIGEMINNKFYFIDISQQKFYVKELDGNNRFICDVPSLLPESIYFYGIYDNKLIIDGSTKEGDVVKANRFYIDLDKNIIKPILAKMSFDNVKSDKNIQILGQSEKDLIVISNHISSIIDGVNKDGVVGKFTISEPQYSIISKQDFFDGSELFEVVKNLSIN